MWNLCFSGSEAISGEMWIIYTAVKCPKILSAWEWAEQEQLLAILLLQGQCAPPRTPTHPHPPRSVGLLCAL